MGNFFVPYYDVFYHNNLFVLVFLPISLAFLFSKYFFKKLTLVNSRASDNAAIILFKC